MKNFVRATITTKIGNVTGNFEGDGVEDHDILTMLDHLALALGVDTEKVFANEAWRERMDGYRCRIESLEKLLRKNEEAIAEAFETLEVLVSDEELSEVTGLVDLCNRIRDTELKPSSFGSGDVVEVVFGTTLTLCWVLGESVNGTISVQTSKPGTVIEVRRNEILRSWHA